MKRHQELFSALIIILLIMTPTGNFYKDIYGISVFGFDIYIYEILILGLIIFYIITSKFSVHLSSLKLLALIFVSYLLIYSIINLLDKPLYFVMNDVRYLIYYIILLVYPSKIFSNKKLLFDSIVIGSALLILMTINANRVLGYDLFRLTSRNNVFILLSLMICLQRLLKSSNKISFLVYSALFLVFSIAIFLLGSRIFYVISFVSILFIVFNNISIRKISKLLLISIVFVIIGNLVVNRFFDTLNVDYFLMRIESLRNLTDQTSYFIRKADNQNIFNNIDWRIIFGYGPGELVFQSTHNEFGYYIDNTYYTFIFKFGIVGLIFIVGILLFALKEAFKNYKNSKGEYSIIMITFIPALLIYSFYNVQLYQNVFIYVFCFLIYPTQILTNKTNKRRV